MRVDEMSVDHPDISSQLKEWRMQNVLDSWTHVDFFHYKYTQV
jgi:hypothetical protein